MVKVESLMDGGARGRVADDEMQLLRVVVNQARETLLISITAPEMLQSSLGKLNLACLEHWNWRGKQFSSADDAAASTPSKQQPVEDTPMELENRYAVFKRSDVDALLDPLEREAFRNLEWKMNHRRAESGKAPLTCVVVEHDWPEYGPTVKAIAGRVDRG